MSVSDVVSVCAVHDGNDDSEALVQNPRFRRVLWWNISTRWCSSHVHRRQRSVLRMKESRKMIHPNKSRPAWGKQQIRDTRLGSEQLKSEGTDRIWNKRSATQSIWKLQALRSYESLHPPSGHCIWGVLYSGALNDFARTCTHWQAGADDKVCWLHSWVGSHYSFVLSRTFWARGKFGCTYEIDVEGINNRTLDSNNFTFMGLKTAWLEAWKSFLSSCRILTEFLSITTRTLAIQHITTSEAPKPNDENYSVTKCSKIEPLITTKEMNSTRQKVTESMKMTSHLRKAYVRSTLGTIEPQNMTNISTMT